MKQVSKKQAKVAIIEIMFETPLVLVEKRLDVVLEKIYGKETPNERKPARKKISTKRKSK